MNPIGRPHFGDVELLASDQVPCYLILTTVSVFIIVRDPRLGRAWMAMRETRSRQPAWASTSCGRNSWRSRSGASFSGFGGALYASMLHSLHQFDFSISDHPAGDGHSGWHRESLGRRVRRIVLGVQLIWWMPSGWMKSLSRSRARVPGIH
jgi:hypothetical protein